MAEKKEKNWYISLMAPNQKGAGFAWLDPTRLYANAQALQDCITDLLEPFEASEIDLVAGIDSVGFILGTGIAIKLNKPMLAIRKKGGLCVKTFGEKYVDYQKTPKELEIRQDAFPEGTKVLIVDQWIETGGTMQAAVNLVERLKGKVAGIAAIAIESNKHEKAKELTMKYKCSHVIPSHLQSQIDNQYLESFEVFEDGKAGYAYNP